MNPQNIEAWVGVATILISAGEATVKSIGGMIHQAHPNLTEAELNAALDVVIADARVRKAQADADAGGNPNA